MTCVGFIVHQGRDAAATPPAALGAALRRGRRRGRPCSDGDGAGSRRSTSSFRSAATARSCGRRTSRRGLDCPVLGVKVGRMGFLTEVEPEEAAA